jgi:hypothetical protein
MTNNFSEEDAKKFAEIEKQQAIVMNAINAIMGSINPWEEGQEQIPILKMANDEMKSLIVEKIEICKRNDVIFNILPEGVVQNPFPEYLEKEISQEIQ